MNFGPHAAFILSAYGAAIAIVAVLVLWILIDRYRLRRTIEDLEAHGVTRRSDGVNEVQS
jgi:heme exporter protein CcmD